MLTIIHLAFLALSRIVFGQTSLLNPSNCEPGSPVTAFTNCQYLINTVQQCNNTYGTNKNAFLNCFCTQPLFNSIFGCESEQRLCFFNQNFDSSAQEVVANWHSDCDTYITFSPTTPVLSTLSRTINPDVCTSAYSSCASMSYEIEQCSSSFPSSSAIKSQISCACDTKILSLAYQCEYVGNVSCQMMSAELTNVFGYSFCSDFSSYFATATLTTASATSIGPSNQPGSTGMSTAPVSITAKPTLSNPSSTATGVSLTSSGAVRVFGLAARYTGCGCLVSIVIALLL